MIRLLSILFIPLIYFYGKVFIFQLDDIQFSDPYQTSFWIAFGISAAIFWIFIKSSSFISIFEHELTHNLWAVLTFNKPTGFHVEKGKGGLFEYQGKGNFLISLSPYFFPTFSFVILPFYLIIKPDIIIYYFVILGIITGYHISSTIKEINRRQPDIKVNGYFFSFVVIIIGNIFSYGLIIAFTIGRWHKMGEFLKAGVNEIINLINKIHTV